MEVFIFLISIGIVVLFAVFALGYNLGRSNTEYELKASAKGEFCIDSNSGILYFHSNDDSNTVVADVDREGSN